VVAVALGIMVVTLVAEPVHVDSDSMAPTFSAGDQVLVDKLSSRSGEPQRGDVIAFSRPDSGDVMIKRVVAVAGDTVGLEDGTLVVNGVRVEESYVAADTVDGTHFGPVTVPGDAVFVLGDDRANSVDSRTFGSLSTSGIVGHVVVRLW